MKLTRVLVPGLLAGSVLLGASAGAFAAKQPGTVLVYAAGQVSNVSSTGFTLTWTPKSATQGAAPKSVQIITAATTRETARKGTTGVLINNEYAVVVGAKSDTGIVARRVIFSQTGFKTGAVIKHLKARTAANRLHRVAGTVNTSASTATSLVITTKSGKSLTFALTSTTKFRVNKQLVAATPAFTAGQQVIVRYKRDKATKTLVALAVTVRPATTQS